MAAALNAHPAGLSQAGDNFHPSFLSLSFLSFLCSSHQARAWDRATAARGNIKMTRITIMPGGYPVHG